MGGEDFLESGRKKHSAVINMFFIFIRVLVMQGYTFVKIYPILYVKVVYFAVCKFYFN